MTFKTYLPEILRQNRDSMRYSAIKYCAARRQGNVCRMITYLILATTFRDLNKGYLEAA